MNAHSRNWAWLHNLRTRIVSALILASFTIIAQADWQWSDHVDILGPTGDESTVAFPQVAVEPVSGIATATWIDTTTFMLETVQAIRFRDGQWGDRQTISQSSGPMRPGYVELPPVRGLAAQVAAGKNGNATVAWTSLLPNHYGLASAMWKKTKNRWLDPTVTPMTNRGVGDAPQIHIGQDQNGIVTAVWRGTALDGANLIQSSRFTNGKWGKPKTLFQGSSLSEPQLAVAKNGAVMVLWTVYEDENHARIVSRLFSGGQWKPSYNFSDSFAAISRVNTSPSIISHRSGSFTAVWHEYDQYGGENSRIMIRRYISGKGYEAPYAVAEIKERNLYHPAVASNESGTVITVVYSAKTFTTEGKVMNTVMASTKGVTGDWAQPLYIGLSGELLPVPQVAMDGEGNSTVVWQDYGTFADRWRVSTTRHNLGSWTYKQVVLCVDCSSPSLAVDKAGNAWAVWVADGQVQSKRGGATPVQ
ncbi:MAG: hypothetical protein RLZZ09_127 [Pseudomonadota bacterium]